jgi:hypothetical protein
MAVKPFGDDTLTAAINRAKACELTLNAGKTKLLNYAQQTSYVGQSETAELVKVVAALAQQVAELKKDRGNRPYNNDRRPAIPQKDALTSSRPLIVCYTCGEPGHISRRCLKRDEGDRNVAANPSQTNVDPQLLQGLLQQLSNQSLN